MPTRKEEILLGILFAGLGVWLSMAGLGILPHGIAGLKGTGQLMVGLIFFFAGAWSFYRGALGPSGQSLPVHRWIEYGMMLPILFGFGVLLIFSGGEVGDNLFILIGVVCLGAALWYTIVRFPGRRKKP